MAQKQLLLGIDTERSRHWLNKLNIEQRLVTPSAQGIEPVEFDRQWQRYVEMIEPRRSEQVFNISVTKIETIINPDRITDNIGRKTVTLICIHSPLIARSES